MQLAELEAEALNLSHHDRARLAERLLASLEDLSEDEQRAVWAEEAARRDAEMLRDPSRAIAAEEVFRAARSHPPSAR